MPDVPIPETVSAMMPAWIVTRLLVEDGYEYLVYRDDVMVARGGWHKRGNIAELHNRVYKPSPSVIKKCKELFPSVIQDCRDAGCIGITAGRYEYNDTFMRYLKLMGFTYFGATMEV